jgi:hypothetical protein
MNLKTWNQNEKTILKWAIAFLLLLVRGAEAQNEPACKPEIAHEFGLTGLKTAIDSKSGVCTRTVKSCCEAGSDLKMYNKWIVEGERANLLEEFSIRETVYANLLKELVEIHKMAEDSSIILKSKGSSTCSVYANHLSQFKMKTVAKDLQKMMTVFHKFIEISFSGVRCMACDLNTQKYFDVKDNSIQYSVEFCREIIVNSLQFLVYFHNHIPKIMNLVFSYLHSCSSSNSKEEVNFSQLFKDSSDMSLLDNCMKSRNLSDWTKCKPICKHINIIKVGDFFYPRFTAYQDSIKNLQEMKEKLKNAMKKQLPVEVVKQVGVARMLTNSEDIKPTENNKDAAPENPKEQKVKNEKISPFVVAFKLKNPKLELGKFKRIFKDEGLNMYQYSLQGFSTDEDYINKVSKLLDKDGKISPAQVQEILQKQPEGDKTAIPAGMAKNTNSKLKLKSTSSLVSAKTLLAIFIVYILFK